MKTIYYSDPINDDFAKNKINTCTVDSKYTYIQTNLFRKVLDFIVYNIIVFPIVWIISKTYLGVKILGKNNIKKLKKTGFFLYGTHTQYLDAFIPHIVTWPKKSFIISNPDAVSITGIKTLVNMLGCLPIPTEFSGMRKFIDAINIRCKQKKCIAIFPEAHIWPFYNGVRPFLNTSFRYAATNNVPIIAMATTYRKRRFIKRPAMTIHLSQPIYCKESYSVKQNTQYLRDEAYNFMKKCTASKDNFEYIHYEYKDN